MKQSTASYLLLHFTLSYPFSVVVVLKSYFNAGLISKKNIVSLLSSNSFHNPISFSAHTPSYSFNTTHSFFLLFFTKKSFSEVKSKKKLEQTMGSNILSKTHIMPIKTQKFNSIEALHLIKWYRINLSAIRDSECDGIQSVPNTKYTHHTPPEPTTIRIRTWSLHLLNNKSKRYEDGDNFAFKTLNCFFHYIFFLLSLHGIAKTLRFYNLPYTMIRVYCRFSFVAIHWILGLKT